MKYVALTFDDGPSNITSKVLDILEEKGIVGSFFLIGDHITVDTKEVMERQVKMGCELCNHSLTHNDMTCFDGEIIGLEIEETTRRIEAYVNVTPKFFRPPFISVNDTMYENISLPFICGVDSKDWDYRVNSEERINNIMEGVKDGAIILMHDFNDNEYTLQALPVVIDKLKTEGYEFVTVSELFKIKNVNPCKPNHIWTYVE